jgi:surface antigen
MKLFPRALTSTATLCALATSLAAMPLPARADGNAVVGTIFGGVLGGFVGSHLARGPDRGVATVGGAVLGAMIGNSIGRAADESDAEEAYYPGGYPAPVYYPPRPIYYPPPAYPEEYQSAYAPDCRPYRTRIVVEGQLVPVIGTVCLQPDGTWRPVP